MKLTEIPIEGIPYDRLQTQKKPLTDKFPSRDLTLIPSENRAVVVNPCRTCMPLGAMFATMGIKRGIPFVQGAQGCTTYVRYTFCRIYKEPATIASASFHEDAAVFGGMNNFIEGIRNLAVRYHPDVIGVVTTCSSEIIGDDMVSFIKMARQKLAKEGDKKAAQVKIVLISTPSFAGSHVVGYDRASKAFLETLIKEKTRTNNRINIIPGMLTPGDIREIKHLMHAMEVGHHILFDTAEIFDGPLRPPTSLPYYPEGGTSVEEVEDMANSLATISLCPHEGGQGAQFLERSCQIPAVLGPPPIGVKNTDLFLERVKDISGKKLPQSIINERGRLIDFMADTLHHTMMKKVAVFGDPDIVTGVTRFVCELGMEPIAVLSGTPSKRFTADITAIAEEYQYAPRIFNGSDLFEFEEFLKGTDINLIIGNSKGVDIAKELEVPLVRVGLMVWDRVGYQKRPIVGYRGGEFLLADIVNSLLDYKYPDDRTQQL